MTTLPNFWHEGRFFVREQYDNWMSPSSVGVQHTRHRIANTRKMYTLILTIQKFLSISNLRHPTGGRTINWYQNIRFDPSAMRGCTITISTQFEKYHHISYKKITSLTPIPYTFELSNPKKSSCDQHTYHFTVNQQLNQTLVN